VNAIDDSKFEFIIPSGDFDDYLSKLSFSVRNDLRKMKLEIKDMMLILSENNTDTAPFLLGDLIHGNESSGIRKIRLKKPKTQGKRGGYRLIAYVVKLENKIYLLHLYDKKKKKDLTTTQKKNLKTLYETTIAK